MAVNMDTQVRAMTTIQNMVPVQRDAENPQVRAENGRRVPNMLGSAVPNGNGQGNGPNQDRVTFSENGLQGAMTLQSNMAGALGQSAETAPQQPDQNQATAGTAQTPQAAPPVAQGGAMRVQAAYLAAAGQGVAAASQAPAANGVAPAETGQGNPANPNQIQQSMNNLTVKPDAALQTALSLYA